MLLEEKAPTLTCYTRSERKQTSHNSNSNTSNALVNQSTTWMKIKTRFTQRSCLSDNTHDIDDYGFMETCKMIFLLIMLDQC